MPEVTRSSNSPRLRGIGTLPVEADSNIFHLTGGAAQTPTNS